MYKLICEIKVGPYTFDTVNSVKIKRSLHVFVDTATFTIPASAILKYEGTLPSSSVVKTAEELKEGQRVEIWLGYDNELNLEFEGYVKRINARTPCEIECEGFSLALKKVSVLESYRTVKLKDLLEKVIKGTDIKLSAEIPDMTLQQAYFANKSGTDVLDWLKKERYLNVSFQQNELYAGDEYVKNLQRAVYNRNRKYSDPKFETPAYVPVKEPAKYELGYNVIKEDQLKFRVAENSKILVKAIHHDKSNKAVIGEAGDKDGAVTNIYVSSADTAAALKQAAENKLKQLKYDGYEGKLTAFLIPFAFPGCIASLEDPKFPVRNGTYLVESTEVTFGRDGARRICELGIKTG